MSCLTCKWFKPDVPKTWEPRYEGQGFDVFCMLAPLENGNVYMWEKYSGDCTVGATHVRTTGGNLCGQYCHMHAPDRLSRDFAREVRQRRLDCDENERLRAEVKKWKERAAERWRKLRDKKEPKTKPKQNGQQSPPPTPMRDPHW